MRQQAAQSRKESVEGQASARERDRHGGRTEAVDDDMAAYARTLRANGVPVPRIAQRFVITSGKRRGKCPSAATIHRILAEGETVETTARLGPGLTSPAPRV
ncbi:hypothetical protein GCM10010211_55460 [Streptomyces albospinus]|uniref:Uncharacterized protein n=1 Tax=Streptomyces albospinus TaxID=285515 RepID=A0ABQ2VF45_9ACTN|nr:hypothetical protein [Streptomyces albospinus]GGU82383.1 hypothetical protein GCM10010211_55460 [Streptomyces albospinus]